MSKNIFHITTVHKRYDTRIFHRECKVLSLFTPITLLVCDGLGNEVDGNINIRDITCSTSKLKRIWHLFFYLANLRNYSNTILHLHDPELFLLVPVLKLFGFKIVLDIHEDYEKQILLKKYIPFIFFRKIVSLLYKFFEKLLLRLISFSVVPQPSFLKKHNSILVGNFISKFEVNSLKSIKDIEKDGSFIYAGGISDERGLENMLVLAVLLKNHGYRLKLAGSFNCRLLKVKAEQHQGWNNIEYLGFMNRDELLHEQKKSIAAVILFNNVGQYHLSYSVKLFEYVACGLPVMIPDFGEWVSVNSQFNIGVNVDVKNITNKDISSVIQLGESKNFHSNCDNFLNLHSLDKNISNLYAKYMDICNDNR